jgi:hypothetical protein
MDWIPDEFTPAQAALRIGGETIEWAAARD